MDRCGSIKETLFSYLCEISKTTKQMSSSNTLPMKPATVRLPLLPALTPFNLIDAIVRLVKAYGELPENAKINETDTFGDEDGECTFEFGDEGEVDIDDI